MNKYKSFYFLFFLLIVFLSGCKTEKKVATGNAGYYTCSMHPQIREEEPGNCPICGMKLIKVDTQKNMGAAQVVLDKSQMQLANIQVMTVGLGNIERQTTLTGTTVINENNVSEISARISGRVEKLFIKSSGDKVKSGQIVYTIYSEELQAAQREFVLALNSRHLYQGNSNNYTQLISGLENRLLLWGMTKAQVSRLQATGTVQPSVPVISRRSGTVLNVNIREGEYVDEGTIILRIADLSTLWVEAQEYVNEWQQVPDQTPVNVRLSSHPNETIQGKVVFTNPELQPQTTINLIRIQIPNPNSRFLPGTQAYVSLNSDQREAIVVPSNAVLRDKQGATVWLEKEQGSFEVRMVKLGTESNDQLEILSGLKAGERVVTSGAYLLNSEYTLKKGDDPMAGMEGM